MFRLIGAVLIVTSALWLGIDHAHRLKLREHTLREMENALALLQCELVERLTPLGDAMQTLIKNADRTSKIFFAYIADRLDSTQSCFEDIWREALQCGALPLHGEDIAALMPLAGVLGRYSAQQQGTAIDAVRQRLAGLARLAEGERAAQSKVCVMLGLCGGVMLVILLV